MSEAGEEGGGCGPEAERETVLLHLWDEQMCLASLFARGDGLAIYWPWVVEEGGEEAERRSAGASPQQLASLDSQASLCSGGFDKRIPSFHVDE